MMDHKKFRERLDFLVNKHCKSKAEFGRSIGTRDAPGVWCRRSKKNGGLPNAIYLVRISELYGVSVDWILGISDEPTGESMNNRDLLLELLAAKDRIIELQQQIAELEKNADGVEGQMQHTA